VNRLPRRLFTTAVAVLTAVGLLAGGWWAGRTALQPPRDPLVAEQPVTAPVQDGTVGRSLTLTATATWPTVGSVLAYRGGIVTAADPGDGVVEAGESLLRIDLTPVVVAVGAVPAFRDLARGAKGPDVQQLQAFLADAGFDPRDRDGIFAGGTQQAVRAWQRAQGQQVTGAVPLGTLVFLPALPAHVRLSARVGDPVTTGDTLAEVLAPAPEFVVPVTDEQRAMIPPSTPVEVGDESEKTGWTGQTADVIRTDDGGQALRLVAPDGGGVCGQHCDQVPRESASTWRAEIVLVPEASGPVVPVAALRTDADGRRFVVTTDGTEVDVEVLSSANGLALVDGVESGTEILLSGAPT
jgi:peptidoglycan hydrolase-like protein with peptidoglycan-binding domain